MDDKKPLMFNAYIETEQTNEPVYINWGSFVLDKQKSYRLKVSGLISYTDSIYDNYGVVLKGTIRQQYTYDSSTSGLSQLLGFGERVATNTYIIKDYETIINLPLDNLLTLSVYTIEGDKVANSDILGIRLNFQIEDF